MLTCKQVSKALLHGDYMKLSPLARLGLRLHVVMCIICGRYNRNVMVMHDTVRAWLRREEDTDSLAPETRLPETARERIKMQLRGVA
jgi:hypothetical protein